MHFAAEPLLTSGRSAGGGGRLVALLVGANSPAVQQGVQGLLLPAPRQAAQALGAGARVDAARLPLGQGAGQAAAAARLLHQLASDRHRRAHGHRLLVARLAGDVGARAPGREPQDECEEEAAAQKHVASGLFRSQQEEKEGEEERRKSAPAQSDNPIFKVKAKSLYPGVQLSNKAFMNSRTGSPDISRCNLVFSGWEVQTLQHLLQTLFSTSFFLSRLINWRPALPF